MANLGPGQTGRTLAARGGAGVDKSGAVPGKLSNPAWTDVRRNDEGGVTEAAKSALTSVKRYWPGHRPDWAQTEEGGDEQDEDDEAAQRRAVQPVVAHRDDPRMLRMAQAAREIQGPEIVRRRRERDEEDEEPAAVPTSRRAEPEVEEEEDEDAIERRREIARERALQRRAEEAELLAGAEEEEDEAADDDEDGSEWETDTDDEGAGRKLIKPVFVPRGQRDTVIAAEAEYALAEAQQRAAELEKEQRKKASRSLAGLAIQQEAERAAVAQDQVASDVDTDDEAHAAEEYESWSLREKGRVMADREAREAQAAARGEQERVKAMSEDERTAYLAEKAAAAAAAAGVGAAGAAGAGREEKAKWAFMQKYYHKGAFFQSEGDDKFASVGTFEIYKRDFGQATGEDKTVDKKMLPQLMQLRKGQFGKAGRTKWTHLGAEDTTQLEEGAGRGRLTAEADPLRQKYIQKMAGVNQPFEKPKHLQR